jgi:hypothetical protein
MDRIAPDDDIIKTSWFDPEENKGKPTRRDRYRYAISGYISDDIISDYDKLDTSEACRALAEKINLLSKYAHISSGTASMSIEKSIEFYEEIETVVIEYAKTLLETRDHIKDIFIEHIQPEINDTLHTDIPDELNELSSGTVFENAYLDTIDDVDIFCDPIMVQGSGTVDVQLNYGKGDDGASFDDNYPFSFTAELDSGNLEILEIKPSIDTSSFYE